MSYLIATVIGAAVGVILTCALLSKDMLTRYTKTSVSVSDSYAAAKAVYKAEVYGEGEQNDDKGENE